MVTDSRTNRPRVFIDADVLSPNEHSASLVILRMAELTLIDALTSEQVITEVERNLKAKMPGAMPAFQMLLRRCLKVVPDPERSDVEKAGKIAHPGDLAILVAAGLEKCDFLATYNIRHYQPGLPGVSVLKPGDLVLRIRHLLSQLHRGT
jgi:hypothetical protein